MQKSVLGVWIVPLAIWWDTSRKRNCWIFEDKAMSFQDLKLYFLRMLTEFECCA